MAAKLLKTTAIFSYGSNSTPQLRGRVLNNELVSQPAYLDGWTRVFCNRGLWGDGGVASLSPSENARTYGSVACLSDAELKLLDVYEKGYTKQQVEVFSGSPPVSTPAFVYLADDPEYQQDPAEPYLTAIHIMLREHNDDVGPISISKLYTCSETFVKKVEYIRDWVHPGVQHLRLDSLCVEANALRKTPWKMPSKAFEIQRQLQAAGITSTPELINILNDPDGQQKFSDIFTEDDDENMLSLFQATVLIDQKFSSYRHEK
jgi:hypothetical protein